MYNDRKIIIRRLNVFLYTAKNMRAQYFIVILRNSISEKYCEIFLIHFFFCARARLRSISLFRVALSLRFTAAAPVCVKTSPFFDNTRELCTENFFRYSFCRRLNFPSALPRHIRLYNTSASRITDFWSGEKTLNSVCVRVSLYWFVRIF